MDKHIKPAVYLAPIPAEYTPPKSLYPPARQAETDTCRHPRHRREKAAVWQLLAKAIQNAGVDFTSLSFQKHPDGHWSCPGLCFSLSHTDGIVAVAVSPTPVGVDVEAVDRLRSGLARRILTPEERQQLGQISPATQPRFLAEKWTQKESVFKRLGGHGFSPTAITPAEASSLFLTRQGRLYCLSVAGDEATRTALADYTVLPLPTTAL